jgi:hypothetical protein
MKMVLIVLLMVVLFGVLPVQALDTCPVTTAANFAITDYGNGFTAIQTSPPDGAWPFQRKIVYELTGITAPVAMVEFDWRVSWTNPGSTPVRLTAWPVMNCNSWPFLWSGFSPTHRTDIRTSDSAANGVWTHFRFPVATMEWTAAHGVANPPADGLMQIVISLESYNQDTTISGLQIDVRNITYSS